MSKESENFLKSLFRNAKGYLELRYIKGKQAQSDFIPLPFENLPWDKINRLNREGYNVYFGACPRKQERGSKEDIEQVTAFWADLDGKAFPGGKEEALKQEGKLPSNLQPSVIIDSGNGYHFYWLLGSPEDVEDDAVASYHKGFMKGLENELSSDSVSDLPRILRLPGTMNVKDPANPLPCQVTKFDAERRFISEDFEDYWIDPGQASQKASIGDFSKELPPNFNELLTTDERMRDTWNGTRPDLKDQSRSGYDMAMANLLALNGFTNEEIASALVNMPSGKGKDAPPEYLSLTIGKARELMPIEASRGFELNGSKIDLDFLDKDMKTNTDLKGDQGLGLMSLSVMLSKPLEEPKWLVDGLLLAEGVSLLGAKPGVGKSTLARNLAISVARGEPFLNRPTTKGSVFYLALEGAEYPILDHFFRMGIKDEQVYIKIGPAPKDPLDRLDRDIEKYRPSLVIVDTIFRLLPKVKEINAYAETINAFNDLYAITRKYKIHILGLHHAKKADKEDLLGSTGIEGSADLILIMKKYNDLRRTIKITKEKFRENLPETSLLLDPISGRVTLSPSSEEGVTTAGRGLQEVKMKILTLILDEELPEQAIKERVRGNQTKVSKAIRELVSEKQLNITREGKRGKSGYPTLYKKAA